ncbi:hypothetical protein [Brevibacterium epidermidis]|uniref:hypothetical protein n=1 Tax=Brevibacterium epidermidis TaxID=1698 RepID=UPI001F537C0F|nr:hypothetical protein [Brevibacterium epidermidis]
MTVLSLFAESGTAAEDDAFRVLVFAVAGAFSGLSAGTAVEDVSAFAFEPLALAAVDAEEEPLPLALAAPDLVVDDLVVDVFAVDVFAVAVLEADDFEPAVLEVVDFEPAGLDAVVLADEVVPVADAALVDFVSAGFDAAAFDEAAFDWVALEGPALDVPDRAAVDFDEAVFAAGAFVPAAFSDAVVVDLVVPAAFGFRRRDDCMEAAGSLRAVRDVFASPSRLPSSVFPPEKKTSTGRSLEFASGINAPSPRPKPLFLRSATTYSSIRNFFSSFSIRQGAAGMWVI